MYDSPSQGQSSVRTPLGVAQLLIESPETLSSSPLKAGPCIRKTALLRVSAFGFLDASFEQWHRHH
jgi:hypothetical protein